MCGIAGIITSSSTSLEKIFAMTKIQAHRGPDGEGHAFFDENGITKNQVANLALGHRRLAILDCTDAGTQPMGTEDGNYWISYNGEVYNYIELRKDLEKLGYKFNTNTDTEVVIKSYREWGVECFSKFNGMWGLAIWDNVKKCLILSRDRFGVKPLHYSKNESCLVFSSEIKGILASEIIKPQLNSEVCIDYLKFGILNNTNRTFFKDIEIFPPGHYAIISLDNPLDLKPIPFWNLNIKKADKCSKKDYSTTFKELFFSSIRLRMRSDVPVGSCLSGGLDSSAIVCSASLDHQHMKTFTSCSKNINYDESKWAEIVNNQTQAVPHLVFITEEEFIRDLQDLIWHQEEPFNSCSIYAQWCLMKEARHKSVPVLLDGQGADEILCGYRKFYFFYLSSLLYSRKIWKFLSEAFFLLWNGDRGIWKWKEGKRYLPRLFKSCFPDFGDFLKKEYNLLWKSRNSSFSKTQNINKKQLNDILFFSIPVLLRYEDRNSMAWSIESRVPFLDYRLVEFLLSLPVEEKLSRGKTKSILRKSLKGTVPDEILNRRDKMGFVTEQSIWMKQSLGLHIKKTFESKNFILNSIIEQSTLIKNFSLFLAGENKEMENEFFRLFILSAWAEKFGIVVE